ncbi:hypothetical protein CB7_88 [Pectobacterium phage vB_PatM_CB7]|uniref:Uncharacterized protein n=2 Tax=root TaxID=1 RepID=K9L3Q3_9CAUD|nr:hypothetical protein phiTE_038 [Pectobacterium phage phiTE]AEZ66204.1 hypothetical protein phiTE_038 [Pectobacterium phage phiTE]ARB11562.1 hypothetical protein CB7_88 [Pectobacterium phage vB_PatM_CB7]
MEEKLSDEDNFNLIADRIEANYKGELHIEVLEIADEGDEFEDGWENITWDGYFTINEKRGLKNYDESARWLESQYL